MRLDDRRMERRSRSKERECYVNYLENHGRDNFVICDDKTGAMLNIAQRFDAAYALQIVHEIYGIIQKTNKPTVTALEAHFALRTLCVHLGWSPADIAVMEQYAAVFGSMLTEGSSPTTG